MDPANNPFSPGAGSRPPELAGRDDVLREAKLALTRTANGRQARSQLLLGLRGVGKTVLLRRIEEEAEGLGYLTMFLEAPEDRRLAEMVVPALRRVLYRVSGVDKARHLARRAGGVLRNFASAWKVTVGDMEFGVETAHGEADSGQFDTDLADLLVTVAQAAQAADRAVALLIDEVQYLADSDLAALLVALHQISQRGLPFIVFGAGLPQLAALAGDAKSYAERLVTYPPIGPLATPDAERAIREPVRDEAADITDDAVRRIVADTGGYPYFLQEWGAQAWNAAAQSLIEEHDAVQARDRAIQALDNGFFRVRFDRLTPREKEYVRAMAELGPGVQRSGDIARLLGKKDSTSVGPLRDSLIRKGMVYSPAHGDNAFTVPLFDAFVRRVMPEWMPVGLPPSSRPPAR